MKQEEVIYNDYFCFYCKNRFNTKSGRTIMVNKQMRFVKVGIVCPNCKAMLPNKGV